MQNYFKILIFSSFQFTVNHNNQIIFNHLQIIKKWDESTELLEHIARNSTHTRIGSDIHTAVCVYAKNSLGAGKKQHGKPYEN